MQLHPCSQSTGNTSKEWAEMLNFICFNLHSHSLSMQWHPLVRFPTLMAYCALMRMSMDSSCFRFDSTLGTIGGKKKKLGWAAPYFLGSLIISEVEIRKLWLMVRSLSDIPMTPELPKGSVLNQLFVFDGLANYPMMVDKLCIVQMIVFLLFRTIQHQDDYHHLQNGVFNDWGLGEL